MGKWGGAPNQENEEGVGTKDTNCGGLQDNGLHVSVLGPQLVGMFGKD